MTITRQGGGSERFTADDAGNLHVRMCDVQVGYALSVRGDAFTHRGVLRTPAFSTRPAPAKESARLNALSEEFPNAGEVELGTIHQLFGVHGALADTAISDAREAYFGYGLARVIRQKFPLEDFAATIREHLSAPGASRARLEGFEAGFVTGDLRVWQSHTAEDVGLRLIEAGASRRVVAGGTDVLRPENSTRLFPETRVASSEYALVLPDMKPLTLRTKPQTFPG